MSSTENAQFYNHQITDQRMDTQYRFLVTIQIKTAFSNETDKTAKPVYLHKQLPRTWFASWVKHKKRNDKSFVAGKLEFGVVKPLTIDTLQATTE